ncbi:MAG: hypothetical protein K9W44_08475 [Candidatus Lokiarchaeota archaeon]|nr:hypothetical protein [Candidatus Harpocratesius repetitus]
MSDNRATVEMFLDWVKQGDQGLAGWIKSVMDDPQKLQEISNIYTNIKSAFGF